MNEYTYDDLNIGMSHFFSRKIEKKDLDSFSKLTGDINPLHMDENYSENTIFGKRVGHGLLLTSFLSTLCGVFLPGKYSLILKVDINMKKPFFIGDTVKIEGKIIKKVDPLKIIVLETRITNVKNTILQEGTIHVKVLR